ncbi:hypothetical protein [Vulcanisaeta distributa]|uniref:ABC-2 type transporter n=1 Tax=Vulcanisaeta distributa (strain DSM 14429 / JCM 11212 / NBRC 100878 / IC-017) TaxID=572478 RepID=E1QQQ3_VULDI|nr:hypothetical protein [Vulcanisaeta distributa]ADN51665.1 conserved hypothetical protein [Vulcanisaeta distributa DSM 14429]
MQGSKESSGGRVFKELSVEVWRGLRLLFSKPSSIMINIITAPLWLAFFILTLRGFGVLTLGKFTIQLFLWAAYAFALYSSWLWGFGNGVIEEGYEGILENVMATVNNLLTHVIGWGIAYSIYTLLDLAALAISFYIVFGLIMDIKDPVLLVISIILASLQLLFISTIYAMLVIRLRSNWVITDIMQFLMPALGGLIPSGTSKYIMIMNEYSPIAYPFIIMREAALGYLELPIPITYQVLYSLITVASLFIITAVLVKVFDKRLREEGKLGLT